MFTKRLATFLLTSVLIFSILLAGCSSNSVKTSANSNKKTGPTVFKRIGSWPKPPLYQGNPFGSGGVGEAYAPCFEGLYQYARTTDLIYPRLAASMPDNQPGKSIVKLRHGVKWNDGEPFTSKDVWAYYTLNNGDEICKYLKDIETPDDYTVVYVWNTPEPTDRIKDLLIAHPYQAQIPYHYYSQYVDKDAELLKTGKQAANIDDRGPFGIDRIHNQALSDALDKNWQDFIKKAPKYPIGTGPYKVTTVTASDMVLEKRSDYWNSKAIKFDKILVKQIPDAAGQYAMVKTGQIDYFDGTQAKDILESILKSNKDLIHYRMPNYSDRGFVYNTQKKPFDNVNFRRAITYIYDKAKIRAVGNWYGIDATGYSMTGLPIQLIDQYVSKDVRDKMTKFTHDPDEATKELTSLGWQKGSDGIYKDSSGKSYNFVMGAVASGFAFAAPGEIAAEQLTKFGLPTKLMAVDNSVYYTNAQTKHLYDMSVDALDVAWSFNEPYWPLTDFYWGAASKEGNFPLVSSGEKKGRLNLVLNGPDGQSVDVDATLRKMLYMNDDDVVKAASKLVYIANENAFG